MSDLIPLQLTEDISDEVDLNQSKSRYDVVETDNGFIVSSPGRKTVEVKFSSNYLFHVNTLPAPKNPWNVEDAGIDPYNFRELLDRVVSTLLIGYKRPIEKVPVDKRRDQWAVGIGGVHPNLRNWIKSKVAETLNHRIHEQWARLISRIPKEKNEVYKAVFHATLKGADFINIDSFYKYPYLVKDVKEYFSAAALVSNAARSTPIRMTAAMIEQYTGRQVDLKDKSVISHQLLTESFHEEVGASYTIRAYCIENSTEYAIDISKEDYFELMQNWRRLYSYNFEPYRALEITLDHATNVSGSMLASTLPWIKLERPIYKRLELMALIAAYRKLYGSHMLQTMPHNLELAPNRTDVRQNDPITVAARHNAHLFQFATEKQIKVMLERIGMHRNHEPYNHRKTKDVMQAVEFALDFPHPHNGNIVGLADKAIDYHRNIEERMEAERRKLANPDTLNALPPIPLPVDENIRFLATIRDLYDESDLMHHCVYSYSSRTVNGYAYIFHVDYKGDVATIEVNPDGYIVQSQGIRNKQYSLVDRTKTNFAITYGNKVLKEWIKGFKTKVRSFPRIGGHGFGDEYEDEEIEENVEEIEEIDIDAFERDDGIAEQMNIFMMEAMRRQRELWGDE